MAPSIVIIGAGLGGIAAAAKLKSLGHSDFILLERGKSVGGVWRDNIYPNVACDTVIELYAFGFYQGHNWSRNFAPGAEILQYLREVTCRFDLESHLELQTEVKSASWNDSTQEWLVQSTDGRCWRPKFLIWAGGFLSQPAIPEVPGLENFQGPSFHTSHWQADVDLSDARVALVGAGATSIQVLPYAATHAKHLYAFVRTPSYVMPKPEVIYDESQRSRFREDPNLQAELRRKWFEHFEEIGRTRFPMNEELIRKQENDWLQFFNREISDPFLRKVLTPAYRFGCKRPVVSNDYYAAIRSPNVTVVPEGVAALKQNAIVTTSGKELEVDIVLWATGFKPGQMLGNLDITDASGRSLGELWAGAPEAYRGTMVKGFPNLFLVNGPNAQAASITDMVEAEAAFIAACVDLVGRHGCGSVEVTAAAHDAYNHDIRDRAERSVLMRGGCHSWYRAGGDGRVISHWPGAIAEFREILRDVRLEDLKFLPSRLDGQSSDEPEEVFAME